MQQRKKDTTSSSSSRLLDSPTSPSTINNDSYQLTSAISFPDLNRVDIESQQKIQQQHQEQSQQQQQQHALLPTVTLILFAVTSLGMNFFNKYVMSEFQTSEYQLSFVFLQMGFSILALYVLKLLRVIQLRSLSLSLLLTKPVLLLGICYLCNTVFSLYALSILSVSTYSVSKRLTPVILITIEMTSAYFAHNNNDNDNNNNNIYRKYDWKIITSVIFIVMGAMMTVYKAIDVNVQGLLFAVLACSTKACYSLLMQILSRNEQTKDLSAHDMVLTNSLLALPIIGVVAFFVPDNKQKLASDILSMSSNIPYLICFAIFMSQGLINQIVIYLCTKYNSAITTTVIGQFKIPVIIVLDILINNKYPKALINMFGLVVVNAAGLCYSFIMYRTKKSTKERRIEV
jgi:solute carrier family 35 protein